MTQAIEIVILEKFPEAVVRRTGKPVRRLLSQVSYSEALKQGDSRGHGDKVLLALCQYCPRSPTSSTSSIFSFIQQMSVEPDYVQTLLNTDILAPLSPFPIFPRSFPPFFMPLSPCFPDTLLCVTFPTGTRGLRPNLQGAGSWGQGLGQSR